MASFQSLPPSPQDVRPRVEYIAPFEPLPWQIAPWRDKSRVMLLTGSAGGGKSRLAAEKIHAFCLRYPGSTALVLRKVRAAMSNSTLLFLRRKVIGNDPRVVWKKADFRFEYDNGSVLAYGGMKDDDQREHIRSIGQDGGLDIAWMEEATHFDEEDFNEVLTRMRGRAAGWTQVILTTNPEGPSHWINVRLILAQPLKNVAVYYSRAEDNVHNPEDYISHLKMLTGVQALRLRFGLWRQAEGLVYDTWLDTFDSAGSHEGNVTEEADYIAGAGPVVWAIDDGYAGQQDDRTRMFSARSHPRAFLLVQKRPNGTLAVFDEHYAIKKLYADHIAEVMALPYPRPEYAVVDKSAAQLAGELRGILGYNGVRLGPPNVEESIKLLREMLAPDENGVRRVIAHPRCFHLRYEMNSYSYDKNTGRPIKEFDHGADALRYLIWKEVYGVAPVVDIATWDTVARMYGNQK